VEEEVAEFTSVAVDLVVDSEDQADLVVLAAEAAAADLEDSAAAAEVLAAAEPAEAGKL